MLVRIATVQSHKPAHKEVVVVCDLLLLFNSVFSLFDGHGISRTLVTPGDYVAGTFLNALKLEFGDWQQIIGF